MIGQWIGHYSGSNNGLIIVNIDESDTNYQGIAYLHDGESYLPSSAAEFQTADKNNVFEIDSIVYPINSQNGAVGTWESLKGLFNPDLIFPKTARVSGKLENNELSLSWTTDIGTYGSCKLKKSAVETPSELPTKQMTWDAFKKHIITLERSKFIFRGQRKPWRLRTSFHRHSRTNLYKFLQEDIQVLHKHLSARTEHVFDLDKPNENGAFFNLVQHHGYPTPLLDWSHSPYVAAFFAYRGLTKEAVQKAPNDFVRIHVFNHLDWKRDFTQEMNLLTSRLHFSVCEFLAIENERMIPQQGISSLTNVDDIESYIQFQEHQQSKSYLTAIDLPVAERQLVTEELQYMGITAGSLFPGLDGSCEEIKQKLFRI